ncbi:uncharacterized protein [Taeniopygia guttata]|uniref:uncharacterized protein n=1 Tax=Taeniopygia guttata TaxID=59729 RepID=UPI003BB93537
MRRGADRRYPAAAAANNLARLRGAGHSPASRIAETVTQTTAAQTPAPGSPHPTTVARQGQERDGTAPLISPQHPAMAAETLHKLEAVNNCGEHCCSHLRPLIKTEYNYLSDDDLEPHITTKHIPYTATELAELKRKYGRLPHESKTEYVFQVSFTGGNQIKLTEQEASGYWGHGVFLTTGDKRDSWSLTQRVAFWAGGTSPLERGDPVAIISTPDQLLESVSKATCLQMIHRKKLIPGFESPMKLPVKPEIMTPLICGLPETLKPTAIALQKTTPAVSPVERPDRFPSNQKNSLVPLYDLLRKGVKWDWTSSQEEALQLLIFEVTAHQALGLVHPTDPFQVGWGFAVSGLSVHIWQRGPEGPTRPVGFYCRGFRDAEKRCTTWEKGLFVVSLALIEVERLALQLPIVLRSPFNDTKTVTTGTPPPDGVAQRASDSVVFTFTEELRGT